MNQFFTPQKRYLLIIFDSSKIFEVHENIWCECLSVLVQYLPAYPSSEFQASVVNYSCLCCTHVCLEQCRTGTRTRYKKRPATCIQSFKRIEHIVIHISDAFSEMQKAADIADMSVLFFPRRC